MNKLFSNVHALRIIRNLPFMAARSHLYIILICLAAMLGAASAMADGSLAPQREKAPDFRLKTLDGATWSLKSKKGMVVIVNFWASWCGPCNIEAPELQRAYMDLDKKKVAFIAVAVDDTEKDARGFARTHKLTFPIAIDTDGTVSEAYQAFVIPMTIIIDRDGRIEYTHMGVITPDVILRELHRLP